MKPEELSNWFLCPDVKEAVGSWVFLQVTFTGSVVLCGRFVVGGSLWEPLDVRCAQHLRIHLALTHVFQTLLDGSGQVHVGLVDAGSFDDSKARHHLNHLHTGFPVTKKKKSGLFTWRLIDVWKKKKEKKENLMRLLQCQVRLAVSLSHSRHLKIGAQFLCIVHPHVPADAVGPGLVAHGYDANRGMALSCNATLVFTNTKTSGTSFRISNNN